MRLLETELRKQEAAEAAKNVLEVRFPARMARFGIVVFSGALALFAGWVRTAEQTPWLAVVAGTGCFLAMIMSLRALLWPKVLARADKEGLVIFSRRLKGGEQRFFWRDVRDMTYEERQVGQWIHKVVRLHFDHEIDPGLREMPDDDNTAHVDAFAAEPGGRELLQRLEALRADSSPPLLS